ncbi:MAG: hypothetical protein A2V81_00785 [Candidatus Abawacabacteria bacterium RBG_16_42_10]|uniref:Uncharacterized protein n=1 Tax=Candidatus Abawacabacteria bacterium RBG_16_42_10 TaxID=1817814 RepID=A0A1F4XHX7_9BACT|nr:MAG: hypothetical protein A2V81_00785 [Candidatus Abawacabacteria bacterium RBG_16_42_10]
MNLRTIQNDSKYIRENAQVFSDEIYTDDTSNSVEARLLDTVYAKRIREAMMEVLNPKEIAIFEDKIILEKQWHEIALSAGVTIKKAKQVFQRTLSALKRAYVKPKFGHRNDHFLKEILQARRRTLAALRGQPLKPNDDYQRFFDMLLGQ